MDIKCRAGEISPSAVVMVSTVRALKYHGGIEVSQLHIPNVDAVIQGMPNLEKHLENGNVYGVPVIVAINRFTSDTDQEIEAIIDYCHRIGTEAYEVSYWAKGGRGGTELADAVRDAVDRCNRSFKPVYQLDAPVKVKIETVAKTIYGAKEVTYATQAEADLKLIEKLDLSKLPICIAKTQSSFSDNPKKRGRPMDFSIQVREIEIAAGAGFIIPVTGKMMRMPGLPNIPAAENIDIDREGTISGLF